MSPSDHARTHQVGRVARWFGLALFGAAALAGCHGQPHDLPITVITTVDGSDAVPGDGICEMTTGAGDCSLRAAVEEANAFDDLRARITLSPGTYTLTQGPLVLAPLAGFIEIAGNGAAVIDAGGAAVGIQVQSGQALVRELAVRGSSGTGIDIGAGAVAAVALATVHDNAGSGIAVAAGAHLDLFGSTLSANGGVGLRTDGTATLAFATVTKNGADGTGGSGSEGVDGTGTATLTGSILADQTSGNDCSPAIQTAGWNVLPAGCGVTSTDLRATGVGLGPLTGDPVPVHRPLPFSPAFDTIALGSDICWGIDQRLAPRPSGDGCDRGAIEVQVQNAPFTVNTSVDADDAVLDGVCDIGDGSCSLRAAITEVNATPAAGAGPTITLAADPVLSLAGTGEDANATGDLDVQNHLTIDGDGHTIDAAGIDRVLHHRTGHLRIRDLVVTGGNEGVQARGGGIVHASAGLLDVATSTLHANTGAAIWVSPTSGKVDVGASTIVAAPGSAAAVSEVSAFFTGGPLVFTRSTVTGTLVSESDQFCAMRCSWHYGPIAFGATAIDGSCAGSDLGYSSGGDNASTDGSCHLTAMTDRPASALGLGPLADNGGPTPTRLAAGTSPLVDAVTPGTALCDASSPLDQRGVPRPDGPGCDIGAVEGYSGLAPVALSLTVTTAADGVDAVPGDGTCATATGACTLRAAIGETNAWFPADTITIAAGIHPTLTLAGSQEDANLSGDLDVTDDLTIMGNGSRISAGQLDRVLDLRRRSLTLDRVTLTGGLLTSGHGAGVRVGTPGIVGPLSLVVVDSRITANRIEDPFSVGIGAGVSVDAGSARIERSTIDANVARGVGARGAGIRAQGAQMTLDNSTVSGNQLPDGFGVGAGVDVASGEARIVASTITSNTGLSTLHIEPGAGATTIGASILGLDPFGSTLCTAGANLVSAGWNVVADTTCPLAGTGDLTSTDSILGPLAANGGPTPTRRPGVGSPAIDAIPLGTPELCDGSLATDQRGVARPTGVACDRGAVEQ